MKSRVLIAGALIQLLIAAPSDAKAPVLSTNSNELVEYTRCEFTGGLTAITVERAPDLPMDRPVDTGVGRKYVSVADGYRVILEFPNTDPFVNLKIELSVKGRFSADKRIVLEGMKHLSDTSLGTLALERGMQHGVDMAAVNGTRLEGGVIGIYSFFDDESGIIATAYILNQLPERRAFRDLQQYRILRDRFAEDFTSCMSMLRRDHG